MRDILFDTGNFRFSYRVAGILVRDGKVLLQKAPPDEGFAFPGGHVSFGETNEQTLIREFKEEMNVDIAVKDLKWVAEIFCPWNGKMIHQICLYYIVSLADEYQFLPDTVFTGSEFFEDRSFSIEFHWIPLEELQNHVVYPVQTKELILLLDEGVKHFVYTE